MTCSKLAATPLENLQGSLATRHLLKISRMAEITSRILIVKEVPKGLFSVSDPLLVVIRHPVGLEFIAIISYKYNQYVLNNNN